MSDPQTGKKPRRRKAPAFGRRLAWAGFGLACLAGAATHFVVGCNGWDPRDPFQHRAPLVENALAHIDAGDFVSAEQVLADYLGTGVCEKGRIGIPETVRQKPDGSFDLGIILFYLGEKYGRVFGDEEKGDPDKDNPDEVRKRSEEIDCALLILGAIANDEKVPAELRARAAYLEGNLEFMRREYEAAVRFYDQALRLIPGILEEAGGDGIGRDAAWNRAIALRRIEDKKDAGTPDADADDASDGNDGDDGNDGADANDAADAQPDGADGADGNSGPDASDGTDGPDSGDAGSDAGGDAGDAGADAGPDGGNQNDQADAGEPDGGDDSDKPPKAPAPGPAPQPDDSREEEQQQQDRLLDKFEGTPTYQQQEAKRRGGRRTMEDK